MKLIMRVDKAILNGIFPNLIHHFKKKITKKKLSRDTKIDQH